MFYQINLKTVRAFAALLFLAAFAASSVKAQSVCLQQNQSRTFTYTSSFGTAGSATATFTLMGDMLSVVYKNTSTSNTYLNGIAFNTTPHTLPENILSSSASRGWLTGVGSGGGLGSYDLLAYGNGNNKRIAPNSPVGTADFTLTNEQPLQVCIATSIVHLTSLPNGSSEKPVGVPSADDGGDNNPGSGSGSGPGE